MPTYLPTVVEFRCPCGKYRVVRTKEEWTIKTCWNCNRTIKVHLFAGRNGCQVTVGYPNEPEVKVAKVVIAQGS